MSSQNPEAIMISAEGLDTSAKMWEGEDKSRHRVNQKPRNELSLQDGYRRWSITHLHHSPFHWLKPGAELSPLRHIPDTNALIFRIAKDQFLPRVKDCA